MDRTSDFWDLTTREIKVLRHLAAGRSNNEIAACLGIAPQMVKIHLTNIFEKAHVQSRRHAVARVFGGSPHSSQATALGHHEAGSRRAAQEQSRV